MWEHSRIIRKHNVSCSLMVLTCIVGTNQGLFYVGDGWRPGLHPRFSHQTLGSEHDDQWLRYLTELGPHLPIEADAFCDRSISDPAPLQWDQWDHISKSKELKMERACFCLRIWMPLQSRLRLARFTLTWPSRSRTWCSCGRHMAAAPRGCGQPHASLASWFVARKSCEKLSGSHRLPSGLGNNHAPLPFCAFKRHLSK
jgi:hypothetical protein